MGRRSLALVLGLAEKLKRFAHADAFAGYELAQVEDGLFKNSLVVLNFRLFNHLLENIYCVGQIPD